jgi:xylulokinase
MPDQDTKNPLFAGLDVSTQSCKLVIIEPASGEVVHLDRVEYDRDLPAYGTVQGAVPGLGEGVSESDPLMWIEAVDTLLGRLSPAGVPCQTIRGISVSGQQHGLVALTAEGALARSRSKLWNDVSTAEECRILTEGVGGIEAMIQEVGNSQRPGYTASKILHMARNEPEHFKQARTLFLVHNYINWHLTGGAQGGVAVMEPGDASGMALWHPGTRQWSRRVMELIHPELPEMLPPIHPSDRPIGTVSPSLAARFHLPTDCMVDAGSGDNMYGAVGTGNVRPGLLTVSLGTSGTAYTLLKEPFIDPSGEIAAFADSTGRHLPLLCVSNLANGYDAFLEEHGLSHQGFEELFLMGTPGSGGRVILPWFQGERTPDLPEAAPLYFGFGVSDFRPELLARALVEGHILSLFDGFQRLPVTPTEIRLTGGLSHSGAWRQTIADVFDIETVPVQGEGAALGAALHAAWVWEEEGGRGRTLEEIVDPFVVLEEEERRRPHPEHRRRYDLLRGLFRSLSLRARGMEGEDPFRIRREILELKAE